jgi:hypothetical protein
MDEEKMASIITWLNTIPFSRRTGNLARDFSDGAMMAEILKYYYPRHVELHNYPRAFKRAIKVENWSTLNRKVLSKLDVRISGVMIEDIVSGKIDAVLNLLTEIRLEIGKLKGDQLEGNGCSEQKTSVPSETLCRRKNTEEEAADYYLALLKSKDEEISAKEKLIKTLTQTASDLESQLKIKEENT